mmetsp:Transcript_16084/g.51203  ORF Transcript_16084/g.51203 Transcript_16084/m.51203 type:complete len:100 (+) Transcript_16084:969-1268(+)
MPPTGGAHNLRRILLRVDELRQQLAEFRPRLAGRIMQESLERMRTSLPARAHPGTRKERPRVASSGEDEGVGADAPGRAAWPQSAAVSGAAAEAEGDEP